MITNISKKQTSNIISTEINFSPRDVVYLVLVELEDSEENL